MSAWYRELFDRLGVKYLDYPFTQGTKQEVSFLIQALALTPTTRVLDIGCGAGRHCIELAKRGFWSVGVDLSRRMVQVARQCAAQQGVSVRVVRADARALPFSEAFDVAISLCEGAFGIMDGDQDDLRLLLEVYRALRPGALLLLNVLHAAFAFRHPENDDLLEVERSVGHWTERGVGEDGVPFELKCVNRYYTCAEIRLLLEFCGFEVIAFWGSLAGHFEQRPVALDDFEFLVLARKPTSG
ncbi:MAG: methyltransferase domain-containing protein [candidate division KSB1 bacterium]|nr:methyltransferase domain-containing protein [candidate division KSB1 bacterium]